MSYQTERQKILAQYNNVIDQIFGHIDQVLAKREEAEAKTINTADMWVKAHGEAINKTKAAKIMGCSKTTIYKLIEMGEIIENKDGKVLTRQLAVYANTPKEVIAKKRRAQKTTCRWHID